MKNAIPLISLVCGGSAMADIKVEVLDIDVKRGGQIIVFLYSENGFPKDHSKAFAKVSLPADNTKLTAQFSSVPNQFAIKVLHDEDKNGEVTKDWTGIIPKEGLGFSNGQKLGTFGPPKFSQCSLDVSAVSSPISIAVIYPGTKR